MSLNKFKVCPVCGEQNPPALLECRRCETDLTGVKVVDDTFSAASADVQHESRPLIKLCDCGTENPSQARKCISCGEDISDVRAAESKEGVVVSLASAVLSAFEGNFSFAITKPVTVIGRESEISDYLKEKTYVSRKHAKITMAGGEVYIENLSGTNPTFVNNVQIQGDAPTLLKSGDEIGLGGKLIGGERQTNAAYFIIEVSA